MAWHNIIDVSLKILHLSCLPLLSYYKKQKLLMDNRVLTGLGRNQTSLHGCTNLISPHWDLEFHVYTYTFNMAVKTMLAHNLTKNVTNQSLMYFSCSTMMNKIIWRLKRKHSQSWDMYVFYKFVIICLVTNSFSMWTIWCYYTWSENLRFQGK